jgi:hypothetical protein
MMKRFRHALAGAFAAALCLGTTTALAGSGVGATFNLGQANTVNATSSLTGTTAGPQLKVVNANASNQAISAQSSGGGSGIAVFGTHSSSAGAGPAIQGSSASTAANAFSVYGLLSSTSPGADSAAVRGRVNSTQYMGVNAVSGVWGSHAGAGLGVKGTGGTGGIGVAGFANASPDEWPSGTGVWGIGSGYGVYANGGFIGISARGPVAGVSGSTAAGATSSSNGVAGYASGGATGVSGNSSSGNGVHGQSTSGNGVYGESTSGIGIYGTSSSNDAVVGVTNDAAHAGIVGANANGNAVYGEHPGGYAGYFVGNVGVTGMMSKGGGSFKIDHPLDPARKYLQHSFVESPDMMNVYNGNVRTDGRGFATVRLPRWFQALNRSFRYQLTILGHAPWDAQARVWDEIAHNRFTIRTNRPNVRVSWQITGIRHDRFANAHRIQVVVPKAKADQGKYLHPELYGQQRRKTIGYRAILKKEKR